MTKASGDGGIDVIAELDTLVLGGRYLFQCKRYADSSPVGASTVRDFYGAVIADRKAVKGVLITTSNFTQQAREFAAQVNIELIDGESLEGLIQQYLIEPAGSPRSDNHALGATS